MNNLEKLLLVKIAGRAKNLTAPIVDGVRSLFGKNPNVVNPNRGGGPAQDAFFAKLRQGAGGVAEQVGTGSVNPFPKPPRAPGSLPKPKMQPPSPAMTDAADSVQFDKLAPSKPKLSKPTNAASTNKMDEMQFQKELQNRASLNKSGSNLFGPGSAWGKMFRGGQTSGGDPRYAQSVAADNQRSRAGAARFDAAKARQQSQSRPSRPSMTPGFMSQVGGMASGAMNQVGGMAAGALPGAAKSVGNMGMGIAQNIGSSMSGMLGGAAQKMTPGLPKPPPTSGMIGEKPTNVIDYSKMSLDQMLNSPAKPMPMPR